MAYINQEAPTSIAAALEEYDKLSGEVQAIEGQLGARKVQVKRGDMTAEAFAEWRVKALFSKRLQEERKRVLRTWIRVQRERRAQQEASALELLSRTTVVLGTFDNLMPEENELVEEARALLNLEVIR